jgi:putative addiction module component (TIGR02574 family)
MTQTAQKLLADALQLPSEDRGELISLLIESLDVGSDADADAVWSDEIARRLKQIDDGQVEMIDWSEARRIIRGQDGTDRH